MHGVPPYESNLVSNKHLPLKSLPKTAFKDKSEGVSVSSQTCTLGY